MKILSFIILIIVGECSAQGIDSTKWKFEQGENLVFVDTLWIGNFELKDTTYLVNLDTLKKGVTYLKMSLLNLAADSLIVLRISTTTGGLYPITFRTSNIVMYPQEKLNFDFAYHTSIGAFYKHILFFFKEDANTNLEKCLKINIVGYTKE
ncbi:MAG TPA: hypothetical protein VKB95_08180 [Chitinophagaceae bacterium]|nr:hypothetical protein [Chitinophagaceae bacterium]